MPRRHRHRKTMKGGFLDAITGTLSGWGSSVSEGASGFWQKTKNATSGLTSSFSSTPTTTPTTTTPSATTTTTPPMTTSTYGGRKTRKRRSMKGGNLAANAAPISDIKTAKPHNIVGGRSRRYRRKH